MRVFNAPTGFSQTLILIPRKGGLWDLCVPEKVRFPRGR